MKKFVVTILFFVLAVQLGAQNASDFFPASPGYVWFYKANELDSNNVPIEENSVWTRDSLADMSVCVDCVGAIVFNAYGNEDLISKAPYVDTTDIKFTGSIASVRVDLTTLIDTALFSDKNFYRTLAALSGWYDIYRFNAIPGVEYLIFRKDTTVTIDSADVPLRFEVSGAREQDEDIDTEIGSFRCKKFLISSTVYYLQPTPLGPFPIPLVRRQNTVWIAPQNWIVKEFAPTRGVDLSQLGGPQFAIPGTQKIIKSKPDAVEIENTNPSEFVLRQNYPNPFNPTTIISYSIPTSKKKQSVVVTLDVYNSLGQKIVTLVNKEQTHGNYAVQFDASNLTSGVYFYTLRAGSFTTTRKMVLLK